MLRTFITFRGADTIVLPWKLWFPGVVEAGGSELKAPTIGQVITIREKGKDIDFLV